MKKYAQIFKATFLGILLVATFIGFTAMNIVSNQPTTDTEPTTNNTTQEDPPTYYTLDKLPLNRTGRNPNYPTQVLKPGLLALYGAHTGFLFDKGDNTTDKFRPQGIAGTQAGGKKFMLISWYGRKQASYGDRGARISVANVTSMKSIKYRHILLVDQNLNTFKDNHAGGIAIIGNKLHVADARGSAKNPLSDGSYDKVLVFDLTKIEKVATKVKKYEYILRLESTYDLPLSPSYLSYDRASKKMIAGTFTSEGKFGAGDYASGAAKLCIYDLATINRNTSTFDITNLEKKYKQQFRLLQGAATTTYDGKDYMVLSRSYGLTMSDLHVFQKKNGEWDWIGNVPMTANGIEDVYFSGKNVWTVSEFSPGELKVNLTDNRTVVAMRISKMISRAKAHKAVYMKTIHKLKD